LPKWNVNNAVFRKIEMTKVQSCYQDLTKGLEFQTMASDLETRTAHLDQQMKIKSKVTFTNFMICKKTTQK